MNSLIDLVNNTGGTATLIYPQTLSGAISSPLSGYNAANLKDPLNAIVSLGSVVATCSGFNVTIQELNTTGASSGSYTIVPGCVYSGGTSASGGSAASGTQVVLRGNRTYGVIQAQVGMAGTSGQTMQVSVVVVGQAGYTASGWSAGLSGQTSYGAGVDRSPSS